METNKQQEEDILDSYREKLRENMPKFDKSPQEHQFDSMTIIKTPIKFFWRPNNYRRKIKVKTKSDSAIRNLKKVTTTINLTITNKLLFYKNYRPNITIQYGKTILTAIYSQNIIRGTKEIFLIEANTIKEIEDRINQKKQSIQDKLDEALTSFIKEFDIGLRFEKPIWDRHEDFIKGEEYIDNIPKEVIIHDTIFKKVYEEGIEFGVTGEPTAKLKNYIKNRAIEDIAPEIAKSINEAFIYSQPLKHLKLTCKSVQDIINNKELVNLLSEEEKIDLSNWTFNLAKDR